MWDRTFLLLLHCVEAAVASRCWQGVTFSEAVVSPASEGSRILRVPGVATLPQCVAACCELPGYELAWLFEGHCYVLRCPRTEACAPRERPGTDSSLAFLRRAPPQSLVLQSLVRGEPYGWRPPSTSSETPRDLEALKDLALFDGPRQDFDDPGMLDLEYPEESQEERGARFNQSEAGDAPEGGPTGSSVAQNNASSEGNISQADEDGTRSPTDPPAAEKATETQTGSTSLKLLLLQKPSAVSAQHDHIRTFPPTTGAPDWPVSTQPELLKVLQSAARAPPTSTHLPKRPVTPDPGTALTPRTALTPSTTSIPGITSTPGTTTTPGTMPPTVTPPGATTAAESGSEVGGSNRGPLAVVGPDRKLLLPVSSLLLDGSGSTDDRGIVSYQWHVMSGPPGLKVKGADQAVATVTGFQTGSYNFTLTVSDHQGATDSASLTVRVQGAKTSPPVVHASGSHSLTLPNNSLVLRGSVSDTEPSEVHFLWVRDSQSPAAGDVLYGSETQASLYLANLVEGTYLFQLRVTDAQGRSGSATATVEVRPEPGGGEEVELEMQVAVSQVSVAQRDKLVRQLAALIHVLDSDIQVRALQGHSHLSTVLRLSVRGPEGPVSGSRLVSLLRNQLLREKSDYLLFRALRVDTVLCLLRCSGRGQCDPISKDCACDPFWTENLIRRYLGDGESNCEWRVLYVILTSFVLMVFIVSVSWTFICCCRRRRQSKVRRKTKYTILDNMDEQERLELRPKFSIKHRSTEHNSSLMMSESELDSDQDTIFSRERPVRSRNRISAHAARNGNAFG
ncbi:dyslexia-associated protein KIAA0319 homolog [Eleginops maclovinus]|uniref:dyslexia-associated protein KIAA0319 homolog n=1 Tax=Eleginops maclovinus TaxID=56733 RepID=UPI0030801C5C